MSAEMHPQFSIFWLFYSAMRTSCGEETLPPTMKIASGQKRPRKLEDWIIQVLSSLFARRVFTCCWKLCKTNFSKKNSGVHLTGMQCPNTAWSTWRGLWTLYQERYRGKWWRCRDEFVPVQESYNRTRKGWRPGGWCTVRLLGSANLLHPNSMLSFSIDRLISWAWYDTFICCVQSWTRRNGAWIKESGQMSTQQLPTHRGTPTRTVINHFIQTGIRVVHKLPSHIFSLMLRWKS